MWVSNTNNTKKTEKNVFEDLKVKTQNQIDQ